MKDRVSIITRTKDRSIFLERALKSIDEQSFNNYEHIILNDGGNKAELEGLLLRYPNKRRKVIHNRQSVGQVAAMNQAVRASEGQYIISLDDDDYWNSDLLEVVVSHMRQNRSRAATFLADIVEEHLEGRKIVQDKQYHYQYSGWSGEVTLYKQISSGHLATGIIMQERSLYDELGGYDETLLAGEDWDYGIRILMVCDVDRILTNESLMFYSKRPQAKEGAEASVTANNLEKAMGQIRNKYMRKDLSNGSLGIGYIMGSAEQQLLNVIRLEAHINHTADNIIKSLYRKSKWPALPLRRYLKRNR